MTAPVYRVYVLLEDTTVAGKYITNIYNADDILGNDLTLPSGSTAYTLPSASGANEQKVYIIKDVIVIDTPVNTKYLQIWLDDKDTSDVIIIGANSSTTVNRQFEKMQYFIGGGTPMKLKQE